MWSWLDRKAPELEEHVSSCPRCRALADELRRRRVLPTTGKGSIALVAEWDTDYGRAWAETFRSVLGPYANLETYSYMRGMDGRLPNESQQSRSSGSSSANGTTPAPNQPQGRARFDYTRRLARKLKEKEGRLLAIGVLGSDFYDKLLLLRAQVVSLVLGKLVPVRVEIGADRLRHGEHLLRQVQCFVIVQRHRRNAPLVLHRLRSALNVLSTSFA